MVGYSRYYIYSYKNNVHADTSIYFAYLPVLFCHIVHKDEQLGATQLLLMQ